MKNPSFLVGQISIFKSPSQLRWKPNEWQPAQGMGYLRPGVDIKYMWTTYKVGPPLTKLCSVGANNSNFTMVYGTCNELVFMGL